MAGIKIYNGSMVIALCIIFVCITITAGAIIDDKVPKRGDAGQERLDEVCMTPACIHSASKILRSMNSSVEPCNDFYEFACGYYAKTAAIPSQVSAVFPLLSAQEKVLSRLQKILEDINQSKAPDHLKAVKNYYSTCLRNKSTWMDPAIALNTAVYQAAMRNGWPLFYPNYFNPSFFNYEFTFDSLFEFRYQADMTNSTKWILEIQERKPLLDRNYLKEGLSNDVVEAYYQYMVAILRNSNISGSVANTSLHDTLSLEIELYRDVFVNNDEQNLYHRYSKTTLEELRNKYQHLRFPSNVPGYFGSEIQLSVDMETLNRVDKWISEKSKESLANWGAWRSFARNIPDYGNFYKHRTKMLNRIRLGVVGDENVSKQCVRETLGGGLGFVLSALYQRKFISENSVDDMIVMLDNIKQKYSEFVQKAEWLGVDTKRKALEKLSNMKNSVVTSRESLTDTELEALYREITNPNPTTPNPSTQGLINRTRYAAFFLKTQFFLEQNFLQLGAELYGDFFYDIDRPKYLNYGATGGIMGHEISQSLGVKGRYYDKEGNLKPWWDQESNDTYIARSQCFVDQYGNYKIDGDIHLNGLSTLNENVADNVGLKATYRAYTEWANARNPEKRVLGLDNYSPKQMFWISMANSFCTNYRPEYMKSRIFEDNKSLAKFRVNGVVSNLQEFSNDFQCDPGTAMNPLKKCQLW